MLHLTRPGASSDSKGHLTLIRNGFSVFNIGYFSGTNTVGFVSANNMNSSNGMFIMSTGFTGIGTFTPQSKFHVYNGVTILSSGTTNNNPAYATPTTLHLRGPAATSTQLVWECVNVNTAAITAGTGYGLSYGTQGGDHVFRTNCTYNGDFSATGSERFRIAANGNIGINSSVPGYTLDVIGNCRINSTLFAPNLQITGLSECYIYNGNVDTYNPTGINNLMIRSWYGIGFQSYDGGVRAAIDTRTGNAKFNGTVTVNSLVVSGSITAGSLNVIPRGIIVMWYGQWWEVPAGWTLCNGTNGAPNLQDKFIVGAGNEYWIGREGGAKEVTLTTEQMPSHNHRFYGPYGTRGNIADNGNRISAMDIWTLTDQNQTTLTGGNQAHENRPPYYALFYIMKL
jgi:hypothetical protein